MGFFNRNKKTTETEKATKKVAPVSAVQAEPVKSAVVKTEAKPKKLNTRVNIDLLKRPVISEKAAVAESHNVYSFVVDKTATKLQIKKAITAVYNVIPSKVRIVNVEGKRVRRGKTYGKRKDWKKAMVTLAKGQSISIHEGV